MYKNHLVRLPVFALKAAAKIAVKDPVCPATNLIYIDENGIYATDSHVAYRYGVDLWWLEKPIAFKADSFRALKDPLDEYVWFSVDDNGLWQLEFSSGGKDKRVKEFVFPSSTAMLNNANLQCCEFLGFSKFTRIDERELASFLSKMDENGVVHPDQWQRRAWKGGTELAALPPFVQIVYKCSRKYWEENPPSVGTLEDIARCYFTVHPRKNKCLVLDKKTMWDFFFECETGFTRTEEKRLRRYLSKMNKNGVLTLDQWHTGLKTLPPFVECFHRENCDSDYSPRFTSKDAAHDFFESNPRRKCCLVLDKVAMWDFFFDIAHLKKYPVVDLYPSWAERGKIITLSPINPD